MACRIGRALCASLSRRRPWPSRIGRGPPALGRGHVERRLAVSPVAWPHRPWVEHNGQSTSGVACPHRPSLAHNGQPTSAVASPHRPWTARPWSRSRRTSPGCIGRGLNTTVSRRRALPARIALRLRASLRRRRAWPGRNALLLRPSLSRRRAWPGRIALRLPTSLSRRRACPPRIALRLRPSLSRRRAWPGRIALRLPPSLSRRRPWSARIGRGLRYIGRGVVDNMRMSLNSQNQKSAKHPSCITIYSSIFHHLFSTFPPHVVRSYQSSLFLRFIIFYVTFYKLKFTKFLDLRLLYLFVNFWC